MLRKRLIRRSAARNDNRVSEPTSPARLPRNVWILGFVSLLMDLSSEIYHALLPVVHHRHARLSGRRAGRDHGVAEATASFAKLASGRLPTAAAAASRGSSLGYGLAALSKPLFPLASGAVAGAGRALRRPHRQGHSRRARATR